MTFVETNSGHCGIGRNLEQWSLWNRSQSRTVVIVAKAAISNSRHCGEGRNLEQSSLWRKPQSRTL